MTVLVSQLAGFSAASISHLDCGPQYTCRSGVWDQCPFINLSHPGQTYVQSSLNTTDATVSIHLLFIYKVWILFMMYTVELIWLCLAHNKVFLWTCQWSWTICLQSHECNSLHPILHGLIRPLLVPFRSLHWEIVCHLSLPILKWNLAAAGQLRQSLVKIGNRGSASWFFFFSVFLNVPPLANAEKVKNLCKRKKC